MFKQIGITGFVAISLLLGSLVASAQQTQPQASPDLAATFRSPPNEARPIIWWYWGESVTTDHGITQDLESLKRVGFGGVVLYEQVFRDAPDALKSLSPEWLARVRFAAAECTRLGISLYVNVSDGFVSGGPWITPELGMQRLVASEVDAEGATHFRGRLPQPPTKLDFYRDVAVLAYPVSDSGILPVPERSASVAGIDLAALFDASSNNRVTIKPDPSGAPVLVTVDYRARVTLRSITYRLRQNSKALVIATQLPRIWSDDFYGQGMRLIPPIGHLEASDNGSDWKKLCDLPAIGYQHDYWDQQTVAFPATTARYFRLNLHDWGTNTQYKDDNLVLGSVELRSEARVDHWESKSGNVVAFSDPDRTPNYSAGEVIDPASILDLTSRFDPATGTLDWEVPPGSRWRIMRFGHTPTGAKTKHGRPEGMGLESDKLSRTATRVQFENYVGRVQAEVLKVPGAKLAGVHIDSAEHGSQNWTSDFRAQFLQRRGYDLSKLLPVMMGKVVGNREISDGILFDVRRTIADMMSDEYFGEYRRLCGDRGMTVMAQAPGIATCLPSDNIQAKSRVDVPMGEFWMSQPDGTIDCKEAAIAAHVYGKPVAAAESFTGSMADAHPAMMKPLADAALALGINRFVVLAYVHQPRDDRLPGVSQDRFYVPYQRLNTWWEYSRGWWDTLSRSCLMLRQGLPVIDILYHLGNDTPLKIATWRMRPIPPAGYQYDACGDEALIQRATARDGRIVLPDGMSYRMLILAGGDRMTLAAARKLRELVNGGAIVLGPHKPVGSPSRADGAEGDAAVRAIADELWGPGQLAPTGSHPTGAGRVYWGMAPEQVLSELKLAKDFEVAGGDAGSEILFAHRRDGPRDIYFLANHRGIAVHFDGLFRVTGKPARAWDAETGEVYSLGVAEAGASVTRIPLHLEPFGSTFVVFEPGAADAAPFPPLVGDTKPLMEISGGWDVNFTPGRGAPEAVRFPQLVSWPNHPDAGVRNYSGTATYKIEFDVAAVAPGERVLLDLGDVEVIASATLNDRPLGTAWKPPYAFDVTDAIKPGHNRLVVRVANLWVNRLIADAGLPEDQRISWTTFNPYRPGSKTLPSGLIGPVLLRVLDRK